VRFAATAADLQEPDGTLSHPRIVYLQHASDPIVWWSTDLIWRKPDWLAEPRGPDVTPAVHWYPFVTFWQLTCDMAVGLDAPAGHGHHYGPEITAAWTAILRPPDWTDADTAALIATPPHEVSLTGRTALPAVTDPYDTRTVAVPAHARARDGSLERRLR
jgi:uncharacterized membrane protein